MWDVIWADLPIDLSSPDSGNLNTLLWAKEGCPKPFLCPSGPNLPLRPGLDRPSQGFKSYQPALVLRQNRQSDHDNLDGILAHISGNRHSSPYIGTYYREK